MPLVKKIDQGLWEVRTSLRDRIARVLFTAAGNDIVLLHGFIKKDQRILQDDLELAKGRLSEVKKGWLQ